MDSIGPVLLIILGVALVVGLIIAGAIWEARRRDAFRALAKKLGFRYSGGRDYGIAERYAFLDRLDRGSNRYAFNVLSGELGGEPVRVFDYHYETHSTDSKGRRKTHHHHFSFFILTLPRSFPELTIASEGWLSKIAQAVGYDDIDFESHEFSRKFCVRSRDKKFAYDVCNVQMMEYLLANDDLAIEIQHQALSVGFSSRLSVDAIERNLGRLREVRSLLPDYIFD